MVFHLVRSIPAVVALAATITLGFGSREEAVSSFAEDNSLSLLQRQSIRFGRVKNSSDDLAHATPGHKVVYIKTHFTGSETLTAILRRYCDNHNVSCAVRPLTNTTSGTLSVPGLRRYVKTHDGEKVDIWPWHVEYDLEPFEKLIPGALTVSMFREPKSRITSQFSHHSFNALKIRRLLKRFKENSGHPKECSSMHSHVKKLSYLDLVLITEDYDRSLVLLAKKLGWQLRDILYMRVHKSKDLTPDHQQAVDEFFAYVEQPAEQLTQAARAWKHECMEVDALMYDAARKTYDEQLHNLTHEEREEVDRRVVRLQAATDALKDCCTKHPLDLFCSVMNETATRWIERTEQQLPPLDHGKMSACHMTALQKLDG